MDKRSVLFVVNTMGRAGMEKALVALLGQLDPARWDVSLLAVVPRGETFAEVPDFVRLLNPTISEASVLSPAAARQIARQTLRSLTKPAALGRFLKTLPRNLSWQLKRRREGQDFRTDRLLWELLADGVGDRYIRGQTFDLAVAYIESGATYLVARHIKAKAKAAFLHVDYMQTGLNPAQDRPFYAQMDAVFCVSGDVRRSLVEQMPEIAEKTHVFHNIIPVAEIRRKAQQGEGFTDAFDGLRLVTVARLHPQKALDVAIPAFAEALKSGLNMKWYIIGEGAERKSLERLIEQHGLQDRFILMGMKANPYPYVAACDLYVQASWYEGWSIALTEAKVLARPIISTNCTGPREQIQDGQTGLLIPLSVQTLADAIIRLAHDIELRKGFSAALKDIDLTEMDQIQMLYDLADGKKPAPYEEVYA
jgi:glycosyltransferase involved in cell wall biosynthesis